MNKCISCQVEEVNLNENNVCETCAIELDGVIDEIVENSNNNNSSSSEIVDNNSNDNFETTVKKRNEQAQEAQEILNPTVEEMEEEEPKKFSIAKTGLLCVGAGLIAYGLYGALKGQKVTQTTQFTQNEEI